MKFSVGDAVCIWGTRYDGCRGTIMKRDAASRFYRLKIVTATRHSRIVALQAAALFPDVSGTTPSLEETEDFILNIEKHSDTVELALSLGVDLPPSLGRTHPGAAHS